MYELRQMTTILTAVSLLLFVLYQLGQIFRNRRLSSANWYVFTSLAACASLTVLVNGVSEVFDQWIGLNNFSWYVGYSLGVIACASAGLTDCETAPEGRYTSIARVLLMVGLAVLLLLASIYTTVIVHTPEWTERLPRSWYEVIFSTSFFAYAAVVTVAALWIGKVSVGHEENPLVRLRLQISNLCRYTALLCFVSKVLYLVLEFPFAGFGWLNRVALLAMTVTGLLWLTMLMPKRLYVWLLRVNPWQSYQDLSQVRELEQLQQRLAELVPAVNQGSGTAAVMTVTDSHSALYRVVIQILDAKKVLDGYLTASPAEQKRYTDIAWSKAQWHAAHELHQALLPINHMTGETLQDVASALQLAARTVNPSRNWLRPQRVHA